MNAPQLRGRYVKIGFPELEGPRFDELEIADPRHIRRFLVLIKICGESNNDGALYYGETQRPYNARNLSKRLGGSVEEIQAFLDLCVELELLREEDGILWFVEWTEWFGRPRETAEAVGVRVKRCREKKAKAKAAASEDCNALQKNLKRECNAVKRSQVESSLVEGNRDQENLAETNSAHAREEDQTAALPPSPRPALTATSQRSMSDQEFFSRIRSCYLALMDRRMPDRDELDFIAELKKFPWTEYSSDYALMLRAIEGATQRVKDAQATGKLKHGKNLWALARSKMVDLLLSEARAGPLLAQC